jgi:uncharacterized membrane protein (DUF106 family)
MAITEFLQANPKISIVVISLIVTFFSTLVTKWLTNQEHLKSLKKRQKELNEEMKKHKDNKDKLLALQSEALKISGTMMKSSFKPLLATFIPFLILLYWLRAVFDPVMGGSWIWWYIISSIIASIAYRKILNVA